jgi:Domain of unknown function (DUF4157)
MEQGAVRAEREHARLPERAPIVRIAPPEIAEAESAPLEHCAWVPPIGGLALGGGGLPPDPVLRSATGPASDPLGGSPIPSGVLTALRRRAGAGQRLPAPLAGRVSEQLGHDLSGVRVHTDSEADAIADSVQAVAFTHGSDIYFRTGAYAPGIESGQRLLVHELTHVAQAATADRPAGPAIIGAANDPAEQAADRSADRIVPALRRQARLTMGHAGEIGHEDHQPRSDLHRAAAVTHLRRVVTRAGALAAAGGGPPPAPAPVPAAAAPAAPAAPAGPLPGGVLNNVVGNTATDLAIGGALATGSFGSWLWSSRPRPPTYGPLSSGRFGTAMSVVLPANQPYPLPGGAEAYHAPDHPGWNALTRRKPATAGGAYYVRAHLLRGKFGGVAQWHNLVPLTNAANNPSVLSHLNTVEETIRAAIAGPNGRPVGYQVQAIYSQLPFGLPRLAVGTLAGWLPFLGPVGELMYWESLMPTALMTSWWYQDAWITRPEVRLIRNWVSTDADLYAMTIHTPGAGVRDLTGFEIGLLTIAEALKFAIAAAPWLISMYVGQPLDAWTAALAGPTWSLLRPALSLLAGWAGCAELVPTDAAAVAAVIAMIVKHLPWWSAGSLIESLGQPGMLAEPRHGLAGELGGFLPSVGTVVGGVAATLT